MADGFGTTIVFLDSGFSVDLEMARYVAAAFGDLGYELIEYSLNDPAVGERLNLLLKTRSHEILCFVSLNYYATVVSSGGKLLHDLTGIPLVFYLMDHPLYFTEEQAPQNAGAMVFVAGRDLVDFVTKYYPPRTLAVDNQGFLRPPFEQHPPSFDAFLARRNELLCPMNLAIWNQSPDEVWATIKQLPDERRTFITRLIEATLTDVFTPIHIIAESIPGAAAEPRALMTDMRVAMNFVKVWRRNHVVRALIELPIMISSEYVPADLQFEYPEKFTLLSIQETLPCYQSYRFVVNSFPLMSYSLHDRVINTLCANGVVITDENNFVRERFTDEVDALFYRYSSGDMAAKITRYLDDPEAAFALTVAAYDLRMRRNAFASDSFANLIEAVKERRRSTLPA